MEGIVQLRRLAGGTTSSCTGLDMDISICGTGFWDASKKDLYTLCDAHGIRHTEGTLHRLQTTHVVVPFTLKDMEVCQAYARRVLTSDKISKALSWDIPIVSIDFVLHAVGKGCRCCHKMIPFASMPDTTAYTCPADCIPVMHSDVHCVNDTPSKYVMDVECSSSGRSTQENGVIEQQEHPSGPMMQHHEENEVECVTSRNISLDNDHSSIDDWGGAYEDGIDPAQVCDPLDATYGSQTPGMGAFNEEDLRNFASIKVTPMSYRESEDADASRECSSTPCSTHILETPVTPSPDCFIPGELLLRAPKGNGVRRRHNITSRSPGMIEFTDSMTFRHLEYMHIDARNNRAVEIVDLDTKTKAIVKPLHFYRVLGQEWMMEFKRYYTGKDIRVSDTSNGLELYLSTKVDGCPVFSVTSRNLVVKRMSRHTKGPMLAMESSDTCDPPYFYRYEYDEDAGRVLQT